MIAAYSGKTKFTEFMPWLGAEPGGCAGGFPLAFASGNLLEDRVLVEVTSEKRLVIRMLELWRRARRAERLPNCAQFTPADAGTDASHLFQIDLLSATGARFTHIGSELHLPDWPTKPAPLVMECPEDSVLSLSSRHWREIVTRRVPVTRGGISRHLGGLVLYRSIMLPLVDDEDRIASIMGAANWRTVEEQPPTPVE